MQDTDSERYCSSCSDRYRKKREEREKIGATINSTLVMRGEKATERLRGRREREREGQTER